MKAEGLHVSWLVQILPYIEERNAYQLFDQSAGAYAQVNRDIRSMPISVIECPSFPGAERNDSKTAYRSTYAGCHYDQEAPIDAKNNGVLFLNSNLRYSDILDGSSQTLLLGEFRPDFNELGWVSGTRASLRNTGTINDLCILRERRINKELPPPGPLEVGGFASAHPGGINSVFADGSVQFISEDIDEDILHQIGHRSDGKLLKECF
ncbi:MAG TPA: hypothetical protein DHW22_12610 [Planctomycetaceae bacterium]|nr:hypothetical protein [Planctomycetaceae bacterium]